MRSAFGNHTKVDELFFEVNAGDLDFDFLGGPVFDFWVSSGNALSGEIEQPIGVRWEVLAFHDAFDEEIR